LSAEPIERKNLPQPQLNTKKQNSGISRGSLNPQREQGSIPLRNPSTNHPKLSYTMIPDSSRTSPSLAGEILKDIPSPRLPVEILEDIVDFIPGYTSSPNDSSKLHSIIRRTLAACSLSTWFLLPRSRLHLYRRITINKEKQFNRLYNTLHRSPHLSYLIDSLDFSNDHLRPVEKGDKYAWMNSAFIRASSIAPNASTLVLNICPASVHPAAMIALSQLTSLVKLELWRPELCRGFNEFHQLVSSLVNLAELYLGPPLWKRQPNRNSLRKSRRHRNSKLQNFWYSGASRVLCDIFEFFLATPQVPALTRFNFSVDLSRTIVEDGREWQEGLVKFLHHSKHTLREFTWRIFSPSELFTGGDIPPDISLGMLGHLTFVEFTWIPLGDIAQLVSLLSSISSKARTTISLNFRYWGGLEVFRKSGWRMMDDSLSHRLQIGKIRDIFICAAEPFGGKRVDFSEFKVCLPQLFALGVLRDRPKDW